ncbi:MAG: hypothetical protein AAB853_03790 [Patescibacteria group bacterium]
MPLFLNIGSYFPLAQVVSLWYNKGMISLRSLAVFGLLASAILLSFFFLQRASGPGILRGQSLSGDSLLETQIKADFRRDGKIDFVDFTFFASFFKET